jgi:hypothetical protein
LLIGGAEQRNGIELKGEEEEESWMRDTKKQLLGLPIFGMDIVSNLALLDGHKM